MKKHFTLMMLFAITFLLVANGRSYAQNISNYTYSYSAGSGSLASPYNTGGTLLSGLDNVVSPVTNIGFDFWFMGNKYDQFSVDENGLLKLGSTVLTNEPNNDFSSSVNAPIISAYWDDMVTAGTLNTYAVSGTPGNRQLVVMWYLKLKPTSSAFYYQVVLYESDNRIEFRYPSTSYPANASGYSLGIGNSTSAFQNIQMSATPTSVLNTAVNNNVMSVVRNTLFTFTPSQPLAPTNLVFSNVTETSVDLSWTDTNSNESKYVVAVSTDGTNFSVAAELPANSTSTTIGGLTGGLYTFQVYAVGEVPGPAVSGSQGVNVVPLAANLKIGPTGDFPSITSALTALKSNGFAATGGSVFELEAAYNSSVETFPINFSGLPSDATYPLVIRPETGATGLEITSSAAQTINLDGAQYITFDGRPGGSGSVSELKIDNALTTGNALLLQNAASNNTIKYCEITGINTSSASGVVVLGTSTAATGNNNNLFEYCDFHDGASKPVILFNNNGTSGKLNLDNTISNCNFYDWYMTSNSRALSIGSNNERTIISGNSFYQTTAVTGISQSTPAIISLSGSSTSNDITFSNNYIGGSAPLCGGTPMSLTYQTYYGVVKAIYVFTGTTAQTSIQGNTIQNIELNVPAGQGGAFIAMDLSIGWVNVGTVTGNTIGSTTGTNGIIANYESPNWGGSFTGIAVTQQGAATDITNISNNVICGISRPTTTGTFSITGIALGSFYKTSITATNNTVGSTTLADAISNAGPGNITGISAAGKYENIVTGNTVANLTQSNTGTSSNQLVGILGSTGGPLNISGNTIFNLKSSSAATGSGSSSSVIGLSITGGSAGLSVINNHIYGVSNDNTSAAVNVTGLYYQGPTTGTNIVSRNLIHGLELSTSDVSAAINGIYAYNGLSEFQNNMIRLGIDDAGNDINTGYAINGIFDGATTSTSNSNNFYHNNVYIGGSAVSGNSSNTFAFNSIVLNNTTNIINNIFVNARSGGTTGQHYAIAVAGTTALPAGITSNSNILYAPGTTGGNIGLYNATAQPTIGDWQSASGLDALSASVDPMYVNPTGTGTTFDLHVQNTNPVEGGGTLIASVTDDFDGETRSTLTPTDIGADAGNFTSSGDFFAPIISFTPLSNTALTTNVTLSVDITDGVGVSSGANQPRLYFKKVSDANAFAGNTSADNGWKYVTSASTSSPYDFTLDFSIINGGSASSGDVIQYFVVAQDDANNYASNAAGVVATTPNPVQNITAAPNLANVNSYLILTNFAGTYTVPGNYATLTGTNGLFDAINQGSVTGNFTVQITDNLVEPGTVALNEFTSPYTMTIVPADATLKTITGNADDGLIRLNGADHVTIDGRFNGSGQYLKFENTSTGTGSTTSTFFFYNHADYNTLEYISIIGPSASTASVVKFYGINPYTGASSFNTIDHCDIAGSGSTQTGIYSYSNVGGSNTNNTISNCNISDFSTYGINLATGNSDWTISGNSFFQTGTSTGTTVYGIYLGYTNGANFLIDGNYIGGSEPLAGGTPWTGTYSGTFYGMYFLMNYATPAFDPIITNNTITNFNLTFTGYYPFKGIYVSNSSSGTFTISGNTIGSMTATDAIVSSGGTDAVYGIQKIGNTSPIICENNNMGGITTNKGFIGISNTATNTVSGTATINGNTIGSPTVTNSIKTGAPTTYGTVYGIYANQAATSTIDNNIVANLTSYYEGTVTSAYLKGLYLMGAGINSISGNTIFNLKNATSYAGTGASSPVVGIHDLSTRANKTISKNKIYALENTSANVDGGVVGIYAGNGSATYSNNVVNLGLDASGTPITTGYSFTGIYNQLGNNSYYFNTLNIQGGAVSGTTAATYALYCNSAVANAQDNVFVNTRSGGTGGLHYTVRLSAAPTTLDYNDYYVADGTNFLATLGSTDYTDLSLWQLNTTKDAASLNADPAFTSATDLKPTNGALVAGVSIGGISDDYDGNTRAATPTMGAFESASCTNPTNGGLIADNQSGCDPFDPAIITSTSAASGETGTLEYKWQMSTTSNSAGFTDVAGATADSYDPGVLTQTTWYKRLARVDCKSDWTGAAASNVVEMTVNPVPDVITANTATICSGTSPDIALEATVASTFSWTVGAVTGSITGANAGTGTMISDVLTNSGTTAGTVEYIVVPTSSTGSCVGPDYTITVSVDPVVPVSLSIFTPDNPVCDGSTVSYFALPSPSTNGATLTYQWKVNGSPVGTNSYTYAYQPTDGDVVSCELSTDLNCPNVNPAVSNTITMSVLTDILPEVAISTNASTICDGESLTFNASPTNGGISPTYQWKVNSINVGTGGATYTYAPADGDVVSCEMTSSITCTITNPVSSNAVTITVNPILDASVSIAADANPVTNGSSVTFTPSPTNGGSSPTYEWFVTPAGGAATSSGTGSTFTYTPADGDAVYALMTSNATPCLAGSPATSNTITMKVGVLPAGVVAYWHLDEATGDTYLDSNGLNDGTGNPSPTAITGQVNGAQLFDGTSTKIDVPASSTFNFAANGDFSVEFWYKGNSAPTSTQVIISRYMSGTYWYIGVLNTGKIRFAMVGGGTVIVADGSIITDGQWHYITATRNGTTNNSKIYVDGSLQNTATKPFTVALSSATSNLEIGNLNGGNFLAGSLDEVAVHNVELTSSEIQQHYTNGVNGLGYYETLSVAPLISSIAPVDGTVGQLYSYDVNASGYPAPTYALTTSPVGMTINATTGLIEWTPTAGGNYDVTVEASNGVNPPATQSFTISVPVPPVIPAGLVAYWHLDETTGNTFVDFTGTNDGTGNPSPTALAGQVNGAQLFDGTSTKIDVPASSTFNFAANGDFSVEFWYKGNSAPTSTQVIISRYMSGTYWYIGVLNTGKIRFAMVGGGTVIVADGSIITDGQWHYITATRNGTTNNSKIYVDGSLQNTATKPFTVALSSATSNLEIGNLNGGNFLAGSLDEVAVHNVELTSSEIQQHYTNGVNGLGYYDPAPAAAQPAAKSAELTSDVPAAPQLELADMKVYPNPFSERLRFEFVASETVNARIDLYDMTGRLVKTVFDQPVESGVSYQAEFRPDAMVGGMYVYRAVMGEQIYNGKVVFKKK